jgi:hypothetical protein
MRWLNAVDVGPPGDRVAELREVRERVGDGAVAMPSRTVSMAPSVIRAGSPFDVVAPAVRRPHRASSDVIGHRLDLVGQVLNARWRRASLAAILPPADGDGDDRCAIGGS